VSLTRIAVLGAGAIGSTIGAYVARAGRPITLIDLWPAHVDAMNRGGLTMTAQDEEFTVPVTAVHLSEVASLRDPFDAVFLSVKSADTSWAATFIAPHLAPGGVLVSAQNGINDEEIGRIIGYPRTLGCVVTIGAALQEPGRVVRTTPSGRPAFGVGELTGMVTPRAHAVAEVLAPVGPARVTANLWGERWAKLVVNCMANALAGITGLNNAELRSRADVFAATVEIAGEALSVAQALGVQVEPVGGIAAAAYLDAYRGVGLEGLRASWLERGKGVGAGRPSLLQDVLKGRRTEVDYLNGYVVRQGRAVGVPTPMNAAVVEVVKRIEAGELSPDPASLGLLKRSLCRPTAREAVR